MTTRSVSVEQEVNRNIMRYKKTELSGLNVGHADNLKKFSDGKYASPGIDIVYHAKIHSISSSHPMPVDYIDNVLYGYYGNIIYKSEDFGTNWTSVYDLDSLGGDIKRILLCSDTEVLLLTSNKLLKSKGWPNPTGFDIKIELSEGKFIEWGLDGNGTKFIAADYGVPYTNSNYMWISINRGYSWTRLEKNILFPGDDENTHFHGVAYDHIDDRFWCCMGDLTYKSQYYSDDNGGNWTELTAGNTVKGTSRQATTISVSAVGMILGSDSGDNNGVYRVLRKKNPAEMTLDVIYRLPHHLAQVRGFAFKNIYDEDTGITYSCWRSDSASYPPIITWSNGFTAGILYKWEGSWSANDSIRNIVVFKNKVMAYVSLAGSDDKIIEIDVIESPVSLSSQDDGCVFGGKVTGGVQGVSVGPGSVTNNNGVAVGPGADASAYGGTVVGYLASAGANTTVIGFDADMSGTNGVCIGRDSEGTGNDCVIVGANSASAYDRNIIVGRSTTSAGAQMVLVGHDINHVSGQWGVGVGAFQVLTGGQVVAVGRLAQTNGDYGVSIGYDAETNTNCVAIGGLSIATNINSVALGKSTATTLDDSVAIGARDLHVQNATKGVVLTSPNGTKYRITVDDAGALSTAVVS